jgi:hypothetical protein
LLPEIKKGTLFLVKVPKEKREEKDAMKQQLILPCIPMGATEINNRLGVFRENDRCTYFLGGYPVFAHEADDQRMFRVNLITID